MNKRLYSERLGLISDGQFQAALERFDLGKFVQAEPIPFGNFGQNVFLRSSTGEYVLRGQPHYWWQFPTEQFFTRQLAERTRVPVPWPYLIDASSDIFGWSFAIMPRMAGLQLADPEVKKQLGLSDKRGIARALGENLAHMQEVTWPLAGRYNAASGTVEPFEVVEEGSDGLDSQKITTIVSYSERVKMELRQHLVGAQACNKKATTEGDMVWVEELIAEAGEVLDDGFEPCLLMEDYKEGNVVVMQEGERWRVSGVFDLMCAHFGNGEADLSRPIAEYLNEDAVLAFEFFAGYKRLKELHPGFARRFPVYMLLDRAILWEFFQRHGLRWWDEGWTFRDWAGRYIAPDVIFGQL